MKLDYNVTMTRKTNGKSSKYRELLGQFVKNGAPIAEVKLSCGQHPQHSAVYFRKLIQDAGCAVKASVRGGRLFLIREDTDAE